MITHKMQRFDRVGQRYGSFVLTKVEQIKGLSCTLYELEHELSGAQVMHVASEEQENVFCLSFRTLPESSNGVAHILEHTVLCGSEKYPVRDPFFSMNRRSLNTFMNAMTGSDFTCYPAASQIKKDFYNLLEVYLDAVFKPNLHEQSFLQEGHRLEFENLENSESLLQYKGVVFNEMKGAWASSDARLWRGVKENLFPDLTYGVDSGGDPKEIPNLTHKQLLEFHRTYYHPSRCLFFFYGDIPLNEHLDFIEEKALSGVEKVKAIPQIPRQKRFSSPRTVLQTYPVSSEDMGKDRAYVALGWLTCHILEQREVLGLAVLDLILTGTDAAPLKYALLKSGLCKQVEGFLEEEISEVPFVLVLKGCEEENAEKIQNIVTETLRELVKKGIEKEKVDAAIHQIELYRKEISGDHYPFGLTLFMRSALLRQHGGKSEDGMRVYTLFEELRESTKDPRFLTGLIEKYFINNPHLVKFVMTPDKELEKKENLEERKALDSIQSCLSNEEKKGIVEQAKALLRLQEEKEDERIEVLPKVTLKDVPPRAKDFFCKEEDFGGMGIFHHTCSTNGIVYADAIFDLPEVVEEDLSYARMFTFLLPQLGCEGRDYKQNLEFIQANTGGVGMNLSLNPQAQDNDCFKPSLGVSGKALHHNVDKLFSLFRDLLTSADFTDVPRLKELLVKQHSVLESSLNRRGLKYATDLAGSGLSSFMRINSFWHGLEYFWKIRDLVKDFDSQADLFLEKMQYFQENLLSMSNSQLVLSGDKEIYHTLKREEFFGLHELKPKVLPSWKNHCHLHCFPSQGRVISSGVAFTCMAMKGLNCSHEDAPALTLAALLCDNKLLHKRIREQGGAYGCGAVNSLSAGSFYFYAYRDPHLSKTILAIEEAIDMLVKEAFDERDLQEAKLGIIQDLDIPISPGSRAAVAYSWKREGKSLNVRQTFRDRIMRMSKMDLSRVAKKYLASQFASATVVCFAGKELLERESSALIDTTGRELKIFEV